MLKLASFTPDPQSSLKSNLKSFIKACKLELTIWNDQKDFSWNSTKWLTQNKTVRFTNLSSSKLRSKAELSSAQLMHEEYIDTVKAYLRYRHTIRPHKNAPREVLAFRALEAALLKRMKIPDITKICEKDYIEATELLKSTKARQSTCSEMLTILKNLAKLNIAPQNVNYWRNPYIAGRSYVRTKGADAPASVKESKLPNQDALLCIADVFARPLSSQDNLDITISSITAILLSAPTRIGETLRMRTNCLRSDSDALEQKQLYLAYWIPKTQAFTRKPIPTTMAPIVTKAIDRIIAITSESRKLAIYMESNPTKFYRHENCPDVHDDETLNLKQISQALGYKSTKNVVALCKHLPFDKNNCTLNSLWQLVLKLHKKLNPNFPYQTPPSQGVARLKMSESLFCFRRYEISNYFNTSPVLLAPFNPDYYRKRIEHSPSSKKPSSSENFFIKNGYEPIHLKSHSLRTFLNRLADQHHVAIEVITEWSGRASVSQTRTYLHKPIETSAKESAAFLDLNQEQEPKEPVSNEDIELYGQGPFHRSKYGICRRSWRAGPCNKFADCTNCSEILMCKGDKFALAAIRADRDNMVKTYDAAMRAIESGERAASMWTMKAEPQIERLNQLIAIYENKTIPDGTPIVLTGTDFNHEQTIVNENAKAKGVQLIDVHQLALTHGDSIAEMLQMLLEDDDAENHH